MKTFHLTPLPPSPAGRGGIPPSPWGEGGSEVRASIAEYIFEGVIGEKTMESLLSVCGGLLDGFCR